MKSLLLLLFVTAFAFSKDLQIQILPLGFDDEDSVQIETLRDGKQIIHFSSRALTPDSITMQGETFPVNTANNPIAPPVRLVTFKNSRKGDKIKVIYQWNSQDSWADSIGLVGNGKYELELMRETHEIDIRSGRY